MSGGDEGKRGPIWSGLEEDDPVDDRVCVDCHKHAPPESSALTLISAKHGWRLLRTRHAEGVRMEWLCRSCWTARRDVVSPRRSSSGGLRVQGGQPNPSGAVLNPDRIREMRETGAYDMISSVCKSLATKLRSRARPCATSARLLRAVSELETEIGTWSEQPGTPERRTEVWATIVLLNAEADELIASRK